ncbi:SDR family NAD(P)-dependent oxidoreductase [Dongia soli]|uniref:SDR family NAD(P)-dependent oxidoreductase n=1 Tax=Dongia soli TaxID=600628 RepID=A0ABU5E9W7_9PROT|nr:SDR family NAD(P)-dependent oxidoreductase [Dongia soli]MDY0882395.1 SDR family NAD(P)-dependent oxidoreductase [Dongia soli]
MTILVTGAAGFIGSQVAAALVARGEQVIGVDSINDYYDPRLKQARLDRLRSLAKGESFRFHHLDLADRAAMEALTARDGQSIDGIVHLAAQAGVRYSLVNPHAYIASNLIGHMHVLEMARHLPKLRQLVYASSSSVYGGNTKVPFSIDDRVDNPLSLYAATKRADEALSISYAHSHGLAQTGLRFFTVYGPWGRPDMAYFSFTKAIFDGEPLRIFGDGSMRRDFTYIDDIVAGVLASLDRPIDAGQHRLYNLGNNAAASVNDLIVAIEAATGRKAKRNEVPPPPGEVAATWADIEASRRDLGFQPKTALPQGIERFVAWYKDYYLA